MLSSLPLGAPRRRVLSLLVSTSLLFGLLLVSAPGVDAGRCQPYAGTFAPGVTCYYFTEPIRESKIIVPSGVTLNGSDGDDHIGTNYGTFNGGPGNDSVNFNFGTFNGGPGNDSVYTNNDTFNGGPGNDEVGINYGTFNGGGGNDEVDVMWTGTFAGGGGADMVHELCRDGDPTPVVWSADTPYVNDCGG